MKTAMVLVAVVVTTMATSTPRSGLAAEPAESLLTNGSFAQWTGGVPDGWEASIGATNGGEQPKSQVSMIAGPALLLRGDAATKAWHAVSQEIPAQGGGRYLLEFETRCKGVKREGVQFDNCYVGAMSFERKKVIGREIVDVSADTADWTPHRVEFAVPENADSTAITIFLSKSGTLMVKSVRVEETSGQASFPALIEGLRERYSFSELKRIDWDELGGRYRGAAERATTPEAFAGAIEGMLAELEDLHVWIEMPDGTTIHPYSSIYRANYDHRAVAARLRDLREARPVGFTGRTEQGFGVIVVDGLPAADDGVYRRLTDAITGLFGAPGVIVDLRSNGGGSEPRAAQIAGLFADKTHIYARAKVRSGPNVTDFRESPPRGIGPAIDEPFTRPVVCLIGPGCVSSGENLALMMKALDQVTLVGQATRGASGNPAPVTLPNGLKVWFSRWVDMEPDGTPIEGRGIQPDVRVEHAGPGDPTFDKAVAILSEKTGVAGSAG